MISINQPRSKEETVACVTLKNKLLWSIAEEMYAVSTGLAGGHNVMLIREFCHLQRERET